MDRGFDSIVTEFKPAVLKVIDYLLPKNQDIGIIYGSEYTTDGKLKIPDPRFKAFKSIMTERKLFNPQFAFEGNYTNQAGYGFDEAGRTGLR